jgi:hypothetical protein
MFGGTEGVGSRFHVLRAHSRFQLYRGRGVPFSFFALPDSFSAIPRASVPIFMFCTPILVFGGTEGVGSRFHVFRDRSRFQLYGGRGVPFSFFALSDSFSAMPRASVPVFMFCAHELIFGGNEGVRSHFHVLRARTHFRRYRGRRVPFSCSARPFSFSAVPRAWGPVFIFRAPGLIFGDSEGVCSRFHVLRAHTRVRQYRGRRVPLSCSACPDTFSAVPTASGPVFMFCAPGLIFGGVEYVGSRFHILRARSRFQ